MAAGTAGYRSPEVKDQNAFKEYMEASKTWLNPSLFWEEFGTMMPVVDALPTDVVYFSKGLKYHVVSILVGVSELARLVLVLVLVGAVARAGKAHHTADRTTSTLILVGCIAAGCVAVSFVFALIVIEGKPEGKVWYHLGKMLFMLTYAAHAAMPLLAGLVTRDARNDVG